MEFCAGFMRGVKQVRVGAAIGKGCVVFLASYLIPISASQRFSISVFSPVRTLQTADAWTKAGA